MRFLIIFVIIDGMKNLYDIEAIRQMERAAFAKEASFAVMQRAATAVAERAKLMSGGDKQRGILALAGPGNNGGDALVAATLLQNDGYSVRVIRVGDEAKLPPDAKKARALWVNNGGVINDSIGAGDIDHNSLILDGLLGIGLKRKTEGAIAELIRAVKPYWRQVLSIDVPSGIDSDSGGRYGDAITAACTITFFAAKPGLFTGDGKAAAGEVVVAELCDVDFPPPCGVLLNNGLDLDLTKLRREKNSHKGTFGIAAIVGGADGMTGALTLASRAAVRLGAGKVFANCIAAKPPLVDWLMPEIMWRDASHIANVESLLNTASCIAIGPGLATSQHAADILQTAIAAPPPLLADADALNLLATNNTLAAAFTARQGEKIITPHAAEAARLLDCSTTEINQNRFVSAQALAKKFNTVVVLKGAGSIIATADEWAICAAGNPGLAQAGSGDVLCGMIAALLAQNPNALFAARAGVWLHATAADDIAADYGEIGLDINFLATKAVRRLNHIIATN